MEEKRTRFPHSKRSLLIATANAKDKTPVSNVTIKQAFFMIIPLRFFNTIKVTQNYTRTDGLSNKSAYDNVSPGPSSRASSKRRQAAALQNVSEPAREKSILKIWCGA
jgi:hypothetical protein